MTKRNKIWVMIVMGLVVTSLIASAALTYFAASDHHRVCEYLDAEMSDYKLGEEIPGDFLKNHKESILNLTRAPKYRKLWENMVFRQGMGHEAYKSYRSIMNSISGAPMECPSMENLFYGKIITRE